MADDDDLPMSADAAMTAAIEGDRPSKTSIGHDSQKGKKGKPSHRTDGGGQPASPRQRLISTLNGGRQPDTDQQKIIDSIEAGFGVGDADPLWILILPALLKSGDARVAAEVRDLLANIKSAGLGKAGPGIGELSEAQRETSAAINALNLKLEKSVERAVSAALAKSEASGGVDQSALARSVSDSIGSRLLPARMGLVAGALAIVAAVAFVAGVMVNKSGYDKYIAELEGKIQGYQSVLGQQKGAAR